MEISVFQFRNKFIHLIDEIRTLLGYELKKENPHPNEDLAMEMMYGGFDFAVVHSSKNSPEKILIECVFGNIPLEKEQPIITNLLNMNVVLAELDASVFCLDRHSGEVIYTLALNIDEQDANTLLSKMTEIVWHGRRWLETRFLNEKLEKGDLSSISVNYA